MQNVSNFPDMFAICVNNNQCIKKEFDFLPPKTNYFIKKEFTVGILITQDFFFFSPFYRSTLSTGV